MTGDVAYQEINTELKVTIVEAASGPKCRLELDARRPGAETDGLFEILSEVIDTEFYVRGEPVLVGSLNRWSSSTGGQLGWPIASVLRSLRGRRYDFWVRAVRLPSPGM